MATTTEQIQMRLPPSVKEAIEKYADMRGLTMTTAIRLLIAAGLEAESEELSQRAAEKEEGRRALLRMLEQSRKSQDKLEWLFKQIQDDPILPAVSELPQWAEETHDAAIKLLGEADTVKDLAHQVRRST